MIGMCFLHGWGYGPDTWSNWTRTFGHVPVAVLDCGYFGQRRMDLPVNEDGWFGVGHSLGFARLLEMDVPWRGLVGVSAFLRFCQKPDRPTGTPPEILDAMIHKFDSNPEDVLSRFQRRCAHKTNCLKIPMVGGLARLRKDLLHLRDLDLRPDRPAVPTLLVHAKDDRIVPLELAHEAQTLLHGSRLVEMNSGGHALPMTRTRDCLRLLQEFLHDLN